MHDGMPYDRIQGQGQGHSREVDRQSPTGLIFKSVLSSDFMVLHKIELIRLLVRLPMYSSNSNE